MRTDNLRTAFRSLSQLRSAQVSCRSPVIAFITKRLKKHVLQQYSKAIPGNINHNDRVVIFSIHGDDLAKALQEDYTKGEILFLIDLMLQEARGGCRVATQNTSQFISARRSLICLLRVLGCINPGMEKTLGHSLLQGCINRLLLYLGVHHCNKDCTSHSQSLGFTLHNLIQSVDTLTKTTHEWKLVEKELKQLQQEVMYRPLLCEVQVPERWISMGEEHRSQASQLRKLEDCYCDIFS
ncbi:hypothetical protein C8J56DRAFT_1042935 [Mycena floridula]|nr:hypothetical protein C8J56DRAFT_1042935 [Mycena floridula]